MNQEFKRTQPTAVLVCSDSWQAGPAFLKHYGLEALSSEERIKRYSEILEREYQNTLANVPDALKSEGVFTIVKGPQFIQAHRINFYRRETLTGDLRRDLRERIIFYENPYKDQMANGYMDSTLIPDWWETMVV